TRPGGEPGDPGDPFAASFLEAMPPCLCHPVRSSEQATGKGSPGSPAGVGRCSLCKALRQRRPTASKQVIARIGRDRVNCSYTVRDTPIRGRPSVAPNACLTEPDLSYVITTSRPSNAA